jgi:hypothetical protein
MLARRSDSGERRRRDDRVFAAMRGAGNSRAPTHSPSMNGMRQPQSGQSSGVISAAISAPVAEPSRMPRLAPQNADGGAQAAPAGRRLLVQEDHRGRAFAADRQSLQHAQR